MLHGKVMRSIELFATEVAPGGPSRRRLRNYDPRDLDVARSVSIGDVAEIQGFEERTGLRQTSTTALRAGFRLDVAPARAMNAFTHPFAYLGRNEIFDCAIGEVAARVDG